MCMNVSTSYEGALPLSSHLEICLQKGSVPCISQRLFLQSSMRDEGALTLSVVDVVVKSVAGVVSVGLYVFPWVWVARSSG